MSRTQTKPAETDERLVRRQFKLSASNAKSLRLEAARLDRSLQATVNAILGDYFGRPEKNRLTA